MRAQDHPQYSQGRQVKLNLPKYSTIVFDLQNFIKGNAALKFKQVRLGVTPQSISDLVRYCENYFKLE